MSIHYDNQGERYVLHVDSPYEPAEILESIPPEDEDIAREALRALEPPDSFATWSALYVSHVPTISHHRDSDILSESNYEIVSNEILEEHSDTISAHDGTYERPSPMGRVTHDCSGPDDRHCLCEGDASTFRSSHFLVGWTETVGVRPFARDESGAWRITDAYRSAMEWRDALSSYPVADEEHYSRLEYEDLVHTLSECYYVPSDLVSEILERIPTVSHSDELSSSDIELGVHELVSETAESVRTYERLRVIGNGQTSLLSDEIVRVPDAPDPEYLETVYELGERYSCGHNYDCEDGQYLASYLESLGVLV